MLSFINYINLNTQIESDIRIAAPRFTQNSELNSVPLFTSILSIHES
jgi:hypothetical protein